MEFEKEIKERIKELTKGEIISISNWWGLGSNPGYGGIIVKSNKEIYRYYVLIRDSQKSYIKKIKDLSDDEYKKITDFIENEIIDKDFEDNRMLDAGWTVEVNYGGISKKIKNNLEIYDRLKKLLEEITESKVDEF